MVNDGSQLEALVAFVEETLLPQGFEVTTNQRVYNDEGTQIAEFDVEIRGKVGTTSIAWLIECRDRPGTGPAPGSWIEQLVGRRSRFGFNKVTAVSTTGFSEGAIQFAHEQGIELREVASLSPDAFSSWLAISQMSQRERRSNLESTKVIINQDTSEESMAAVLEVLRESGGEPNVLRSTKSGQTVSLSSAFLEAVKSLKLFEGIAPNSGRNEVNLHVKYSNDDDHFVIDTHQGPVRVVSIFFRGELIVVEKFVPVSVTSEYRDLETGGMISQVATFEHDIAGTPYSVELHHIGETGETHVIVRNKKRDG